MPIALITGASRGFGKEIHQLFASEGFECVTPTRSDMDMMNPSSIRAYVDSIDKPIDVLVNNAAINHKAALADIQEQELYEMFKVNVEGPINLMKAVLPGMAERNQGRVVNIGSIWGVRSYQERAMYSMTKFGIDGVSRAIAREYGKHNVLVNTDLSVVMIEELILILVGLIVKVFLLFLLENVDLNVFVMIIKILYVVLMVLLIKILVKLNVRVKKLIMLDLVNKIVHIVIIVVMNLFVEKIKGGIKMNVLLNVII